MLIPRRAFADPGASFWTSLRYFCVTRLVIAAVLLGASLYGGERISIGMQDPGLFARTAVTYAVLAATFGYLAATRQQHFYLQLGAQLLVDVVGLTLLMSASGGTRSGLALLMLLPIAGSAILSPALLAIGFAALCSLAILAETVWRELRYDEPSSNLLLAALFGAASFAIAIVMNRLAARLIVQERIARQRGYDLRAQIEINRLVVADMQDGVLILAADGTPRAANPAALRMLGLDDARALVLDGWRGHVGGTAISRQFVAWRSSAGTIGGSFDLTSTASSGRDAGAADGGDGDHEDGSGRRLRVRFVAPEGDALASGRYVVFLEDLLRVEQRAQQLKLAAMGRLTASIAHEIRNPLAAIAHAGALLEEETGEQLGLPFGSRNLEEKRAGTQRMVTIVRENAQRLNRIVEEILQLSRRAPVNVEPIPLDPWLAQMIDEFCRTQGCARSTVDLVMKARPTIHFNSEHLRQVLVNLLSNAIRYSSGREASVTVVVNVLANARSLNATALALDATGLERGDDGQPLIERIELVVQDDGPGIDKATRANLFEPFFTTHHRGTGLGLYLARELCLANDATLDYSTQCRRHASRRLRDPRGRHRGLGANDQPARRTEGATMQTTTDDPGAAQGRPAHSTASSANIARVLVVDDEPDLLELLELTLVRMGLDVDRALTVAAARERLAQRSYALCLTDMRLPDASGMDLVALISRDHPATPVAVITAFGSTENAVAALKAGAFDYLSKPVALDQLRSLVQSAVRAYGKDAPDRMRAGGKPSGTPRPASGGDDPPYLARLLGESSTMADVRAMIKRVARSQAPVAITGESGSGKELAARAVHDCSGRRDGPFVAVNCGAIPEQLVEAEFFGYRKGRVHRRRQRPRRLLPDGEGRHAVPRRGRRPAARDAGQAAARDPGAIGAPRRRHERGVGRRAAHQRDASEPRAVRDAGPLPAGPVLSAQRHRHPHPAAARAARGHPAARAASARARSRPTSSCRRPRSTGSSATTSPATSASSATSSSARPRSPKARRSGRTT